jgi:hypothetical protein
LEVLMPAVIAQIVKLLDEHYVFPEVAAQLGVILTAAAAEGRYEGAGEARLAELVTTDLQSVNGDLHLRLGVEPVQLSGMARRDPDEFTQLWTSHVPLPKFGGTKPMCVLTSERTFSGGEALSFDLQEHGRAVIVGERTRGGAHPREGFKVDSHLEVTIPIARSVSPISGGNWEGTGVLPDVPTAAADALTAAHRLALEAVSSLGAEGFRAQVAAEASRALLELEAETRR